MSQIGFVAVEMTVETAFCVSAPESGSQLDRPVAKNPLDKTSIVPVSSLMGSLRSHALQDGDSKVRAIFGSVETMSTEAAPTLVRGLGVEVTLKQQPITASSLQPRKQTAVNRFSGAATNGSYRESEAVPPGAAITLYLEVAESAIEQVLTWLQTWTPFVGGSRTTGLGRACVDLIRWGLLDVSTPEGMALMLTKGGADLVNSVATTESKEAVATPSDEASTDSTIRGRTYTFEVTGPLFVRGERSGNKQGALQRGGVHHIDGSTWKGIFRSGAEFVVHSIAAAKQYDPTSPLLAQMFGTTMQRGALVFAETPIQEAKVVSRPHVAIDRVTGGASDRKLFVDEPVVQGRITLDVRSTDDLPDAAWALLDAVAVDIHDGVIGVGGATARGYGSLRLAGKPPAATNLTNHLDTLFPGGTYS
jgi:CRISPR/Cas system CSM-associated protein Csm3 (group 7 of RAMP superfamily)